MTASRSQSSTQPLKSDIDDVCGRVSELVASFTKHVREVALTVRLEPMDADGTMRHNVERMADQMIGIANVAVDVEERLAHIMVLRQFLDVEWTKIESSALERFSRTEAHRYMPNGAKVARVIEENKTLWETLRYATEAVEVGKRAVDRLVRLEKAASRAAGIISGPA
jgi:hypothetical protein